MNPTQELHICKIHQNTFAHNICFLSPAMQNQISYTQYTYIDINLLSNLSKLNNYYSLFIKLSFYINNRTISIQNIRRKTKGKFKSTKLNSSPLI